MISRSRSSSSDRATVAIVNPLNGLCPNPTALYAQNDPLGARDIVATTLASDTSFQSPHFRPCPIADRINSEVAIVLKLPETGERLETDGAVPDGGTPEQFLATIKKEIEVWRKVVREVGVKPE